MAISSNQVQIGTTPSIIFPADVDGARVELKNIGANVGYLGNATVTHTSGYNLVVDESIFLFVGPNEPVYGITESDRTTIAYIATLNQ